MPQFRRTPIAWVALTMCSSLALAQTAPSTATVPVPAATPLQKSTVIQDTPPDWAQKDQPIFVEADTISGQPDLNTVLSGNVKLRKGNAIVYADKIDYFQPNDTIKAFGHVRVNQKGNVFEGAELDLKLEAFEGFFTAGSYRILKNDAYGDATRIDFLDEKHAIAHQASYTTCRREGGPSWLPAWLLRADKIHIDNDEEVGQADGAKLYFKGVPVLAAPSFSFPLTDKRKTGLLAPTFGIDGKNGFEYSQPYYWNIAPNRDDTLSATVMSKRGLELTNEFRYLEKDYFGLSRLDWMPNDMLRSGHTRWSIAGNHTSNNLVGVSGLSFLANVNRVSDNDYWTDFPRGISSLTIRQLSSDATLSWASENFSTSLKAQKWQILQDSTNSILPTYNLLPQWKMRYARTDVGGFDFSVDAEYSHFSVDSQGIVAHQQPNAQRTYALAQISRPWIAPGWYVTPKIQLHSTHYNYDRLNDSYSSLYNGSTVTYSGANVDLTPQSRVLPSFSIDSGLTFERDAKYFGRAFRQTLEPRAFYVYTPYRDQSKLFNYDTALNDFNFASIFTENAFSGQDRVSDNNLLTLGVTSRLLDPDTGDQAVALRYAQRLRFAQQQVILPGGSPQAAGYSDMLVGATINWDPSWSFDGTLQYNPLEARSSRSVAGIRYTPGSYRSVNLTYRFQNDPVVQVVGGPLLGNEQTALSWQWPLNDLWGGKDANLGAGRGLGDGHWYTLGHINYDHYNKKFTDAILGFEYDAGCWLGRVVIERQQTSLTTFTKRILFQIELSGLTKIGANPLQTLRDNIPRYQYLREKTTVPGSFTNYD